MSQGGTGGYNPLSWAVIFGAIDKFFGQQAATKNKKINNFADLLNKEMEFLPSGNMKCPKRGFFH